MFEIIIVSLIIMAIAWAYYNHRKFSTPKTQPSDFHIYNQFEKAQSLFVNRSELTFFNMLQSSLPPDYFLMSKVRLEDIIQVKSKIKNPEIRWKLRGRVKSRHIDFLIIDKDGTPRLAIELDGASHQSVDQVNADKLKNGLFKSTGIPFMRIDCTTSFAPEIQTLITRLNA